jgi:hypothetical protein
MKRKIAIGLEVFVVVLVATTLGVMCCPAAEPTVRKGMTEKEVTDLLGEDHGGMGSGGSWTNVYYPEPDGFGNRQAIFVNFDEDGRVVDWNTRPLSRGRPPWLDRTVKAMGL